jgi:hypothetical protein
MSQIILSQSFPAHIRVRKYKFMTFQLPVSLILVYVNQVMKVYRPVSTIESSSPISSTTPTTSISSVPKMHFPWMETPHTSGGDSNPGLKIDELESNPGIGRNGEVPSDR